MTKRPNFFIVGAPKCGTTSLAAWLTEHPNVFMSPVKEPHFFNTDHRRSITSIQAYEALFRDQAGSATAVGEASVWYLYSTEAIRNICAYTPTAKFIVMLRNPIDMAPSLHEELLFTGDENVGNFTAAWDLQEERRYGRRLPQLCWEPKRLLYGDVCRLGTQLDRLVSQVSKERVLAILLDDLLVDTGRQYRRVLDFLALPDDERRVFPIHNAAKMRRWPTLTTVARLVGEAKSTLGIAGGLGLWRHLESVNRVYRPRSALPPEVRKMLQHHFADDVASLEILLCRDLKHWLA